MARQRGNNKNDKKALKADDTEVISAKRRRKPMILEQINTPSVVVPGSETTEGLICPIIPVDLPIVTELPPLFALEELGINLESIGLEPGETLTPTAKEYLDELLVDYFEELQKLFGDKDFADNFNIEDFSTWPAIDELVKVPPPPVTIPPGELPDVGGAVDSLPPPTTVPVDPPGNDGNVGGENTEKPVEKVYDFPVENQPLVGVIDTGLGVDNADIDYARVSFGRDRLDNDNNPLLDSGEGNQHGSHVLGIIGATRNNGVGIDGINDKAPLWVGRSIGSGKWAESLREFVDAAKGAGQKNAIANLSLDLTQTNPDGNVATRYELTPLEREAIEYARQNKVLIVAAAGNDGDVMSVLGQASQEFDNIITVGAADGENRAAYSSYGNGLDILAPGGTADSPVTSTVGDGLGTMAGTSVAAAKVTGGASLVWAANPDLNYRQVAEILKATAKDLGAAGWDEETGAGLLDLDGAVERAKVTEGLEYDPEPWYAPESWSGEGKVAPGERAVSGGNSIATAAAQPSPDFTDKDYLDGSQEKYYKLTVDESGYLGWTTKSQDTNIEAPWVRIVNEDGSDAAYQFNTRKGGLTEISVSGGSSVRAVKTGGEFLDPGTYVVKVGGSGEYEIATKLERDRPSDFAGPIQYTVSDTFGDAFSGRKTEELNSYNEVTWLPGSRNAHHRKDEYGIEVKDSGKLTLRVAVEDTNKNVYTKVMKLVGDGPDYEEIPVSGVYPGGDRKIREMELNLNKGKYQVWVTPDVVDEWGVPHRYTLAGGFEPLVEGPVAPKPGEGKVPADAGEFVETFVSNGVTTHYYTGGYLTVQPNGQATYYRKGSGQGKTEIIAMPSPVDRAGDSPATARDIGVLDGSRSFKDFIGPSDRDDFYRFTVNHPTVFKGSVFGEPMRANFDLLSADGKPIFQYLAGMGSMDLEALHKQMVKSKLLLPGTYYLHVKPRSEHDTNYTLSLSPTSLGPADYFDTEPAKSYFGTGVKRWFYNDVGKVVYTTGQGAIAIDGPIADYYINNLIRKHGTPENRQPENPAIPDGLFGIYSGLGAPVGPIHTDPSDRQSMQFEGGSLVYDPQSGIVKANYRESYTYERSSQDFELVGKGGPQEIQWKNDYSYWRPENVGRPTGEVKRIEQGWVQEFVDDEGKLKSLMLLKDGQEAKGGWSRYNITPEGDLVLPKGGPYLVQDRILDLYERAGGYSNPGGFGFPTSSGPQIGLEPDGKKFKFQSFENTRVREYADGTFSISVEDAFLFAVGHDGKYLHDTYWNTYRNLGGASALGYPTSRVMKEGDGYTQKFEGGSQGRGAIMKSNDSDNSYWVGDDFWQTYLDTNRAKDGILRYPTSNRYGTNGGERQNFKGGAILKSNGQSFAVYGKIGSSYLDNDGESSWLGFPTSGEYNWYNGIRQDFENGYIYFDQRTGQSKFYRPWESPNQKPVAHVWNQTMTVGESLYMKGNFSVSDGNGDRITKYAFYNGTSHGWFEGDAEDYQGNKISKSHKNEAFVVSPDKLHTVRFVGASVGSDPLGIRAFDGQEWSNEAIFTVVTKPKPAPVTNPGGNNSNGGSGGNNNSNGSDAEGEVNITVPDDSSPGNGGSSNSNGSNKNNGSSGRMILSKRFDLKDKSIRNDGWGIIGGSAFDKFYREKSFGLAKVSFEAGYTFSAFGSAGTFSANIPTIFDINWQLDRSGKSVAVNFSSKLNSGLSLETLSGFDLSAKLDVAAQLSTNFSAPWPNRAISFPASGGLDLQGVMNAAGSPVVLDPSLQAKKKNEHTGNSIEVEDVAFQAINVINTLALIPQSAPFAKPIRDAGFLQANLGINIQQKSTFDVTGFEIDYDNQKNGNELIVNLNSSGTLNVPIPDWLEGNQEFKFKPTIKPLTNFQSFFNLGGRIEGGLNSKKLFESAANRLPVPDWLKDQVKEALPGVALVESAETPYLSLWQGPSFNPFDFTSAYQPEISIQIG